MDGPANDHSDSDSGESWTLVDHNLASEEDSFQLSQNIHKSFIENYEKDEDTDGISIISDSEPESPSSFLVESCHSILEAQAIKEEIPICSPETNTISSNINNEKKNENQINEDIITGDSIKHKIYVHRRNNRISTVLNIMMLVSVMTAAGVAIGHMWGAKNDCPSQATPSFNKILSDLYKLQAENAHYRNKLRELSLIIEDNLHNECEKESEISNNNSKLQTFKCRQQKIDEIQKFLKSSIGDGRRTKRSVISHAQNPEDNEFTKKFKGENEFRKFVNANISKLKAAKDQKMDEKVIPKKDTDNLLKDKIGEELTSPDLKEEYLPERKVSYADSLKTTAFISENNSESIHKYTEKKIKHAKKVKDYPILTEASNSQDDFVKDGRYSIPKPKLDIRKHDRQKSYKNKKRRNKYEDWELKGGLLKDYDDLSIKLLNGNHFVKSKINANDKKRKKLNKKIEDRQDTFNINDSNNEAEYETKLNWFDNRAQLRKEARMKQVQELLMDSTSNSGEWYFKRMRKREECRTKQNSTSKKIQNKKNFKTRP